MFYLDGVLTTLFRFYHRSAGISGTCGNVKKVRNSIYQSSHFFTLSFYHNPINIWKLYYLFAHHLSSLHTSWLTHTSHNKPIGQEHSAKSRARRGPQSSSSIIMFIIIRFENYSSTKFKDDRFHLSQTSFAGPVVLGVGGKGSSWRGEEKI